MRNSQLSATPDHQTTESEKSKSYISRMSERETVVELPFAADCCPCVEKLRTALPFTVGIRDGVVHLVPTLGA
jgi:hypothetical protein